jgi:hypothetical protein
MDTISDHLLIFKTDIGKLCTNCQVHKALDAHHSIWEWSIDTEDEDCVLRVVSPSLTPEMVISLINDCGHKCTEL